MWATLLLLILAPGGDWFPRPENVATYKCVVAKVQQIPHGSTTGPERWQADAQVLTRTGERFERTIGSFEPTSKGRNAGMKACSQWMGQIDKQLKGSK